MQLLLTAVAAFALFILLRRPGTFSPSLILEGAEHAPVLAPGDEDEEMPETDRAPMPWLPWAVAAVGLVRVSLLVALHA
ncbi:MAG TPA: hypothetical protein VGH20_01385 [Myxococcales bacterium]|jgi:hypothetical protein